MVAMKFTPTLPQEENFIPIVNMFFFVFTSVVAWKKNKRKRGSISLTIFCLHRENFLFIPTLNPQTKQMAICFFLRKFCFKSLLYYTSLYIHSSPLALLVPFRRLQDDILIVVFPQPLYLTDLPIQFRLLVLV